MSATGDDASFWRAFSARSTPVAEFGHVAHLRAGYLCLLKFGSGGALKAMRAGLREMLMRAVEQGYDPPVGYHETITVFWLRVIAARVRPDEARDSAAFFADHPELFDKHLIAKHYSIQRLMSDAARTRFIEPDRAPLPAAIPAIGPDLAAEC